MGMEKLKEMQEGSTAQKEYLHTSVSAGFNQHTPPYWRLMLPTLAARYVFRWVDKIGEMEKRTFPGTNPKLTLFFEAAVGLGTLGTTAYFAYSTAQDMRNIFSEAVAYEFDKDAKDVTVNDLLNSKNTAVIKARSNLIKYTGIRALINSSFFVSFLPGIFKKADSVDLGVGLNGAYLVTEVIGRDTTFFEQIQNLIDRKINQRHALGDNITASDLLHLFELNALDSDPSNAFKGAINTPLWKQSQVIFERMAELMNATYQNKQDTEKTNFTLPEFIYLVGNGLIQPKKVEQTLALIEVANRYDIKAVKQVVQRLNSGADLDSALQGFPLKVTEISDSQNRASIQLQPTDIIASVRPRSRDVIQPPAAYTDKLDSGSVVHSPAA